MELSQGTIADTLVILILLGVICVFVRLALWARRRPQAAVLIGALFSIFAPDPTYEQRLKTVAEEQQRKQEEDESGAPPHPDEDPL